MQVSNVYYKTGFQLYLQYLVIKKEKNAVNFYTQCKNIEKRPILTVDDRDSLAILKHHK